MNSPHQEPTVGARETSGLESVPTARIAAANLGFSTTRDLLALCISADESPIEDAVDHLAAPHAEHWFNAAIEGRTADGDGPGARVTREHADAVLLHGEGGIEAVTHLKDVAKRSMMGSQNPDDRAGAALVYFLTVAAALTHHGELISSRGHSEIEPIFEEIVVSLPERYASIVESAAKRLRERRASA